MARLFLDRHTDLDSRQHQPRRLSREARWKMEQAGGMAMSVVCEETKRETCCALCLLLRAMTFMVEVVMSLAAGIQYFTSSSIWAELRRGTLASFGVVFPGGWRLGFAPLELNRGGALTQGGARSSLCPGLSTDGPLALPEKPPMRRRPGPSPHFPHTTDIAVPRWR
jgi:hypothetical protein